MFSAIPVAIPCMTECAKHLLLLLEFVFKLYYGHILHFDLCGLRSRMEKPQQGIYRKFSSIVR